MHPLNFVSVSELGKGFLGTDLNCDLCLITRDEGNNTCAQKLYAGNAAARLLAPTRMLHHTRISIMQHGAISSVVLPGSLMVCHVVSSNWVNPKDCVWMSDTAQRRTIKTWLRTS
jgi:hypothetical protein